MMHKMVLSNQPQSKQSSIFDPQPVSEAPSLRPPQPSGGGKSSSKSVSIAPQAMTEIEKATEAKRQKEIIQTKVRVSRSAPKPQKEITKQPTVIVRGRGSFTEKQFTDFSSNLGGDRLEPEDEVAALAFFKTRKQEIADFNEQTRERNRQIKEFEQSERERVSELRELEKGGFFPTSLSNSGEVGLTFAPKPQIQIDLEKIAKKTKESTLFDIDFNKKAETTKEARERLKEAKISLPFLGDVKVPDAFQIVPFIGGSLIPEKQREEAQKQADITRQTAGVIKGKDKGQGTDYIMPGIDLSIEEQRKTETDLEAIRSREKVRKISEIGVLFVGGGVTSKLFSSIPPSSAAGKILSSIPVKAGLSALFVEGVRSEGDKRFERITNAQNPRDVVRGIEDVATLGAGVIAFGTGIKVQQSGVIRGKVQQAQFNKLLKGTQEPGRKFDSTKTFLDVSPEGEILRGQTQLRQKTFDSLTRFEKSFISSKQLDLNKPTKVSDFFGGKQLTVQGGKQDPKTIFTERFFFEPSKIKTVVGIENVVKSPQTKLFFFGDELILTQQTGKPTRFEFGSESKQLFFGKKGQFSISSNVLEPPSSTGSFEIPFGEISTQRTTIPRIKPFQSQVQFQTGETDVFQNIVFPIFGVGQEIKGPQFVEPGPIAKPKTKTVSFQPILDGKQITEQISLTKEGQLSIIKSKPKVITPSTFKKGKIKEETILTTKPTKKTKLDVIQLPKLETKQDTLEVAPPINLKLDDTILPPIKTPSMISFGVRGIKRVQPRFGFPTGVLPAPISSWGRKVKKAAFTEPKFKFVGSITPAVFTVSKELLLTPKKKKLVFGFGIRSLLEDDKKKKTTTKNKLKLGRRLF